MIWKRTKFKFRDNDGDEWYGWVNPWYVVLWGRIQLLFRNLFNPPLTIDINENDSPEEVGEKIKDKIFVSKKGK